MCFIKASNTLSLPPSRERGKCSSHAEAEWRLHRKSYNKLPCALSQTLRDWCSGRFLGEGRCRGGGSHDVWGHTTIQFQPWNFWVPFPTHWSQHCKIELRNNLSTYTATDSNPVLDFISQHSNSMSRNHNIARGLSTQKVITQSPPLKCHAKKKKKGKNQKKITKLKTKICLCLGSWVDYNSVSRGWDMSKRKHPSL